MEVKGEEEGRKQKLDSLVGGSDYQSGEEVYTEPQPD